MSAEPFKITMTKEGDFDGLTPMEFERSSFSVQGQKIYSRTIEGPAGLIDEDFFGLLSGASAKVVGIAGSTWNPMSVARVLTSGSGEPFRQEVQLTPEMTHVVLFPGDKLAIRTAGEGRPIVHLVINDLSESEHVSMALQRDLGPHATRFRLIKDDNTGFSPNLGGSDQEPNFTWDPASNIMEARVQTSGKIPARLFCTYPKHQGCFASVRVAGGNSPGASEIYLVEAQRNGAIVAEGSLPDMQWSKVLYLSHDDKIAFGTQTPAGGIPEVVIDIELVRVEPGDRLRGRYAQGL